MDNTAIINLSDNQLATISRTADLPSGYKGREGNVLLAYEYSQRKGLPLLHVIQNMHFIQGSPSWKAEYQRAMLNRSGYIIPPMRYKWNDDHTACRAVVTLKSDGSTLESPEVSLEMADKDGWSKNPKWRTIPEVMLMNRATTFLIRYYFPDVLDGIMSTDEVEDIAAMNAKQPLEYEDKTEQPAQPAATEAPQISPKVRLWRKVLEMVGGDKGIAENICKAVVSGQEVTEDNIDGLISTAESMIHGNDTADEIPEHLAEEPF